MRTSGLGARLALVPATEGEETSLDPEFREEGAKPGDRRVLTINGVEFAFRYCPPGEFPLGRSNNEF